jgi:hypothetical protein
MEATPPPKTEAFAIAEGFFAARRKFADSVSDA